jgi:hypothetical protein
VTWGLRVERDGKNAQASLLVRKTKKAFRLFIINLIYFLSLQEILMVGVRGFEPPAFRSRTERSTKLSHTPSLQEQK